MTIRCAALVLVTLVCGASPALANINDNPYTVEARTQAVLACVDVDVAPSSHNLARLRRSGDTLALDDIALHSQAGRLANGIWILAVMFQRDGADHSVAVFAYVDGKSKYVGGFKATGHHLSASIADTLDVTFFRAPAQSRTVAAGGETPENTYRLNVVDGKLMLEASEPPASSIATSS